MKNSFSCTAFQQNMTDVLRTYTVSHLSPGPEVFQTAMNTKFWPWTWVLCCYL